MRSSPQTVEWVNRIALAIVFIWFGLLKVADVSPAEGLVQELLHMTLPFVSFDFFIIFLGVWEAGIGVLFLFPRLTRWAFWIMMAQMATTIGPLVLLPHVSWISPFVPSLEGQYIIKNVALIALAYTLYVSHVRKNHV
jgi:uncharacterized membrane protein YphA (DoxX/SURF4 family)